MMTVKNNSITVAAKLGINLLVLFLAMMAITLMTAVSALAGSDTGSGGVTADYTVTPMHNGYCAISFSVPGTTKEVFLTGIREDKSEEIYRKFIDEWKDGKRFLVTDPSIIDAEKTMDSDDADLCFAATVCNMLVYSGWAEQIDPSLGLVSEDDLFEEMISQFNNTPENYYFVGLELLDTLEWFFSGTQASSPNAEIMMQRSLRNYPNSGGYLTAYDISTLGKSFSFKEAGYTHKMKSLLDSLKAGDAVGVTNIPHAVTCFGMVTDTSYPDTDEAYYGALIISDSDDDMNVTGKDRRTLPNKFEVVPIVDRTLYGMALNDFAILRHYDGSAGIETDSDATKDRRKDPDLRIKKMSMDTEPGSVLIAGYVIPEGDDCFLNIGIQEYSDVSFAGEVSLRAVLYQGEREVASKEFSKEVSLGKYETEYFSMDFSSAELSEGDYRAVVTVEAASPVKEAFLCNNIAEYAFSVIKEEEPGYTPSSIELDFKNDIVDVYSTAYPVYNDSDLEFLRSADAAAVAIAHYDEGENPEYQLPQMYAFGDDGLPLIFGFGKEKEFTRACVSVCSNGRVYKLYSPEYRVPYANLTVTLDQDTTKEFTAVPYESTDFYEDEKVSFTIENNSIACDDAFEGEYFLSSSGFTGMPLSKSVSFTIEPGEKKEGFEITGWDKPLTKDTDFYLAWKEKGGDYNFHNNLLVGRVHVLPPEYFKVRFEPGDGTGQMEDTTVDAGEQLKLPSCGFAAPEGEVFYKWRDDYDYIHYAEGEECTVNRNKNFEALYRDRLLAGHSVDIRDHTVDVNFYLTPGENMQADDISVRFSWGDNESVAELSGDSFDPEKQAYRATCKLDISDKNEVITAEILSNGKVIAVRTYTLEKYYDDMWESYEEFSYNDYSGETELSSVLDALSTVLTASGEDELPDSMNFPYFPSVYDSEDMGAEDMPDTDTEQEEFEKAVSSGGYDGVYDGKPHKITVTVPEGAKIRYGTEEGKYDLDENPEYTNAGTYRVYYEVSKEGLEPVTGSETVNIQKADITVKEPSPKDLTYNGQPQELMSAGETQGGEIQYALGTDAENVPAEENFSKTIPSGTAAGDYYVWFKTVGDKNHKSTKPGCVPVTIKRKDISKAKVTLDKNELQFNGKDQVVSVKSVVLDGTTLSAGDYKLAGEFSGFEVRKYTLQVEGVGNYTGSVPVEWNIAQAPTGTVTTTPTGSVTPKPTETTKPATTTPTVTANPTATTKPSPIPFTPRPQRAPVTTVSPTPTATPSPKAGAKDEDSKSGTGSGSGSAGGTSPGKATAGGSVATGDETNAEIWLIMMAACVVVLITLREKRTGSSHEE